MKSEGVRFLIKFVGSVFPKLQNAVNEPCKYLSSSSENPLHFFIHKSAHHIATVFVSQRAISHSEIFQTWGKNRLRQQQKSHVKVNVTEERERDAARSHFQTTVTCNDPMINVIFFGILATRITRSIVMNNALLCTAKEEESFLSQTGNVWMYENNKITKIWGKKSMHAHLIKVNKIK